MKKTILFVAPYPPPFSGPESSAKAFLESGIQKFFNIHHFDTNYRKSNSDKGRINFHLFLIFFRFVFDLNLSILRSRPNVIYYYVTATTMGWLFKDIWLILIAKVYRKKVVIHMRAGHFSSSFEKMPFLLKKIVQIVCNLVDVGIAQSPSLKNQFRYILNEERVEYIYNMIDADLYRCDSVEKSSLNVFFMGHLSQAKGYVDVLRAMPKVIEKYPDIVFSFAGTKIAKERNVFVDYTTGKPIIQENIEKFKDDISYKNYEYLGILDEESKIAQLNRSSIFLLPSYSEGFSMSVLEAMSMSVPIITTPVGALKDIVVNEENGLLVSPGNPNEIADAILTLLDNRDLCKEISRNNRVCVENKFSSGVVVNDYVTLFNSLVE